MPRTVTEGTPSPSEQPSGTAAMRAWPDHVTSVLRHGDLGDMRGQDDGDAGLPKGFGADVFRLALEDWRSWIPRVWGWSRRIGGSPVRHRSRLCALPARDTRPATTGSGERRVPAARWRISGTAGHSGQFCTEAKGTWYAPHEARRDRLPARRYPSGLPCVAGCFVNRNWPVQPSSGSPRS